MESKFILIGVLIFLSVSVSNGASVHLKGNTTANITEGFTNKTEPFDDLLDAFVNLIRKKVKMFIGTIQENLDVKKGNLTRAFWQVLTPSSCPRPLVPKNGGLVCVHAEHVAFYCKPMCNQGYDFAFLRRSRLYEECGRHTDFSWTTQYIGGNRLAECVDFPSAVAGNSSAYFTDETCQQATSKPEARRKYKNEFIEELKQKNIKVKHKEAFIICGE
ncbi:uncharacterized protein LOC128468187 [Spea bombifrons]|uniref:uncharacterized protein LOC128468187 n=1 Tax=Spea bombifrons TaxID=233779 RepID=UPI002349BC5C|nr:uncharacterized protein LOC128468187 [Spea bombifrons]